MKKLQKTLLILQIIVVALPLISIVSDVLADIVKEDSDEQR